MIARLRAWWLGLGRRERVMTAVAATFVLLAIGYLVAIEPAWKTRVRLDSQHQAFEGSPRPTQHQHVHQRDGRRHGVHRTKASSRAWPAACDFSGWNCAPSTLSRPTMVGKVSPYSAVANTDAPGTPAGW